MVASRSWRSVICTRTVLFFSCNEFVDHIAMVFKYSHPKFKDPWYFIMLSIHTTMIIYDLLCTQVSLSSIGGLLLHRCPKDHRLLLQVQVPCSIAPVKKGKKNVVNVVLSSKTILLF